MSAKTAAVLLAGGKARRMGGGDKCLRQLGKHTILEHVIEKIRPQVSEILLNANGDLDRFESFGFERKNDSVDGFAGPLAGILTGLEWLDEKQTDCTYLLSIATDTPFLPTDLVQRLHMAQQTKNADIVTVSSNGRTHPVIALWPLSLKDELRQALIVEDERKIDRFTARYNVATVDFQTNPIDPFFNTNRPDDLIRAEELLGLAE